MCSRVHVCWRRNWWQQFIRKFTHTIYLVSILHTSQALMGSKLTVQHEPASRVTHPPQHMLLQNSETLFMTHQHSRVRSLVEKSSKYGIHPPRKRHNNQEKFKVSKLHSGKSHRKTLTQQVKKLGDIFISNNETEGASLGLIYSSDSFIYQELRIFFTLTSMICQ